MLVLPNAWHIITKLNYVTSQTRVNGKAIPLQALTCPEGSRRLRLPDLNTIGTNAPAAFTPQEIFLVLISVSG